MSLKPWREVVKPHRDVSSGRYQRAEFAADLAQVLRGDAQPEYQDPVEFFARTYLTRGISHLLVEGLKRLSDEMVTAMDSVSAVVEENTAATQEMASNSAEVTRAIENIASIGEENSAAVEEVSAATEEMSAQVEEVSASAQSLADMALMLQDLVAQFKFESRPAVQRQPLRLGAAEQAPIHLQQGNGHKVGEQWL